MDVFAKLAGTSIGIPLILGMIGGLVQIVKRFQTKDPIAWENALSCILGVALGGGWYILEVENIGRAVLLGDWIIALFFGLLIGLAVSGLYDIWQSPTQKLTKSLLVSVKKPFEKEGE